MFNHSFDSHFFSFVLHFFSLSSSSPNASQKKHWFWLLRGKIQNRLKKKASTENYSHSSVCIHSLCLHAEFRSTGSFNRITKYKTVFSGKHYSLYFALWTQYTHTAHTSCSFYQWWISFEWKFNLNWWNMHCTPIWWNLWVLHSLQIYRWDK